MSNKYIKQKGKYVLLTKRNIEDEDMDVFANQSEEISSLILDQNNISFKNVIKFRTAIWNQLEVLSLCCNNIGAKGCREITRVSMNNLQQLNLSKIGFTTKDFFIFQKANGNNLGRQQRETNSEITNLEWVGKGDWAKMQSLHIILKRDRLHPAVLFFLPRLQGLYIRSEWKENLTTPIQINPASFLF